MNAAVWRYDVRTRKFEIFAEGTSNPWGMDFDEKGNCFLACCVIPHLFHIVPGGIYIRQAGSSFNPYSYGYMKEICDHTHHKESGWAHAGLLCLDGEHVPEPYRGSVIMGSIHGCSIKRDVLRKHGSSFIASHAEDFLVSDDKNFRPINLRWGPGGDIYVIDWHDQNPCHQAKPDSWDKERGRVYRIQRQGAKTAKAPNLTRLKDGELVDAFTSSKDPWMARTAHKLLHERKSLPGLTVSNADERLLLKGVLLAPCTAVSQRLKVEWPSWNGYGAARAWTYRLASEQEAFAAELLDQLVNNTAREALPEVRRETASVAISLAANHDISPLLHALLQHKEDANDPMIPHLVWLAYERRLSAVGLQQSARVDESSLTGGRQPTAELDWLAKNASGNLLITDHILPKVMRRLVASNRPDDLAACVDFIGKVDDPLAKQRSLEGLVEALKGRVVEPPPQWEKIASALTAMDDNKPVTRLVEQLSVNFKSATAMKRAYDTARDSQKPSAERAQAVRNVVLLKHPESLPLCLAMVREERDLPLRLEACRSLAMIDKPEVAREVLTGWSQYPPELQRELLNVLKTRKEWARQLLDAVGQKRVPREDVHNNIILAVLAFNDRDLNQRVEKVWGQVRMSPPPAELEDLIVKMRKFVTEKEGDPERGRKVFEKNCLQCHKYEGKGHDVGPNLDGAERSLDYILINVLDPNRVIGLPYYRKTVLLKNGKLVAGLLHAEDANSITIKGENAVLEAISRDDIEMEKTEPKSLMPEGLDKNISPEELRDLVRYLIRR
jgi:putative heme-binding domain-containing protein